MFNGKDLRNQRKSKPRYDYQVYSQSDTTMEWAPWEYADHPKGMKHVTFNHEYEYPSHDSFYRDRNMTVYNYPSHNYSSKKYEKRNDIFEHDTEGSHYTDYYRPPQQIFYTETDSAYTTVDMSDSENDSFDDQPRYGNNYTRSYKKMNNFPTEVSVSEASSFGGVSSVYFAREPISHQPFKYEKLAIHKVANESESEFQEGSATETDEESQYTTDSKVKNPDYKIYTTKIDQRGTSGAFNKELQTNSQERLISVTNYDNIPMLAFKSKHKIVSPEKSMSGVVYLPVIVMKNEEKLPTSKDTNTQLLPCKDYEVAEKPTESLKVYTAVNKGRKNIFEKNNNNTKQTSKVMKTENTVSSQKSTQKESDSETVSSIKKSPYIYLPSVLKMPGAEESKFSKKFSQAQENRLKQSKIDKNRSNTNITCDSSINAQNKNKDKADNLEKEAKDIKEMKNTKPKKSSPSPKKSIKYKKIGLKNKSIVTLQKESIPVDRQDNKSFMDTRLPKSKKTVNTPLNKYGGITEKKPNTSETSKKSATSDFSILRKSRARKRNGSRKSQISARSAQRLIGKSPSGSIKGSPFFAKAHKKELNNRSSSNKSHKSARSAQRLIGKSPSGSIKGSSFFAKAHKKELNNRSSSNKSHKSAQLVQRPIGMSPSDSVKENSYFAKSYKKDSKAKRESTIKKSEHDEKSHTCKQYNDDKRQNLDQVSKKKVDIITKKSVDTPLKREEKSNDFDNNTVLNIKLEEQPKPMNKRKGDEKESMIIDTQQTFTSPEIEIIYNKKGANQIIPSKIYKKEADFQTKNFMEESKNGVSMQILPSEPKFYKEKSQHQDSSQTPQHRSTRSVTRKSIMEIKPPEQKSVIENQDNNKMTKQHKTEQIKQKSEHFDPNHIVQDDRNNLANKFSDSRESKGSQQKNVIENKDSSKMTEKKIEEIKQIGQCSDPNQIVQGSRKSIAKEIITPGQRKTSLQKSMGIQETNKKTAHSRVEEDRNQSQSHLLNQTVQGDKKSLVNERKNGESLPHINKADNHDFAKKSKQYQFEESEKNQRQMAEDLKSTVHTSQTRQFQNTEKLNEGTKKSVKETTVVEEKGRSMAQSLAPNEIKSTVSELPENPEERTTMKTYGRKNTITGDQGQKGVSIVSIKQPEKKEYGGNENNVNSMIGEKLQGESTTTVKHVSQKNSLIEKEKLLYNGQIATTHKNPTSKVQRKTGQSQTITDSMYLAHQAIEKNNEKNLVQESGSKHTIQMNQKQVERGGRKGTKKSTSQKKNIFKNGNQSKSTLQKNSNVKSTSQIKVVSTQQSKHKAEWISYSPLLWGYDVSTLLTYCFRVAQFFLGVSVYDKLIEILVNFP